MVVNHYQIIEGVMKNYYEQNYPVSIKVTLTFKAFGQEWTCEDEIKGLNPGHALHLAGINWPDAISITIK